MSERATTGLGVRLLAMVGLAAAIATILSFLGAADWRADLFAAFRLHLAVLLGVLTLAYAVSGHPRSTILAAIGFGINAAPTLGLFMPIAEAVDEVRPPLRIVSFNVNAANGGHDGLVDYIVGSNADFILLYEITPEQLEAIRDGWPVDHGAPRTRPEIVAEARRDRFGIALLTRHRLEEAEVIRPGVEDFPAIRAQFSWGDAPISLLAMHPPPPVTTAAAAERDRHLMAAAAWASRQTTSVIVAGDLNVTPFSPVFGSLIEDGDLIDSAAGFGWQPTWPASVGPLGIPIDHVLHDQTLFTTERARGPSLGSDHRSLEVTLRFVR